MLKKSNGQKSYMTLAAYLLVGLAVLSFSFLGVAKSFSGSAKVNVEGDYIEAPTPSDSSLGSIRVTPDDFPNGLKVDDNYVIDGSGFWVGDQGNATYGEVKLQYGSGTSSVATLLGKNVYVYDAYVVLGGVPTTTSATANPSFLIGTSSVPYIVKDGACGATAACSAATAHEASILNTGSIAAGSATSTVFFKADYQGTDTRDGSGTRYVVPVSSTDYLTLFASSSPATNFTDTVFLDSTNTPFVTIGTGGDNATYAVIKYFTLE